MFISYGISTCFKPHQTLYQIIVAPKDKTKIEDQTGVVYRIPCGGSINFYVGESKRTVGELLDNIKVLCREDKLIPGKVREAIFISKETSSTLNGDGGRELSKIYDSLLETPSSSSRTPPTASSGSGSVSHDSKLLSIRGGVIRGAEGFSEGKMKKY